jgi:hypothetical protein
LAKKEVRPKISKTDKYLPNTIFSYSIEHLLKKDKIRFYYALKGRDGKSGIVKHLKIEQLGRAVLFVTGEHEKEVKEFLDYWKCKYRIKKVFIER